MPVIALRSPKPRKHPTQCQKPRGLMGRFVLWSMNRRHSRLTDWGLQHVAIHPSDTVLDVGCGGGRTVGKLAAAAPTGKVVAIDYSAASVDAACRTNRESIAAGRVTIEEASVQSLPFADRSFDLITAVETHFWWQDLAAGMRECYRVLKPGGRMLVIAEFYNGGRHARYADKLAHYTTMASLDVDQHRAMLADVGFADVQVDEEQAKGWISVVGTRPLACARNPAVNGLYI